MKITCLFCVFGATAALAQTSYPDAITNYAPVAWGYNNAGQTSVPASLTNVEFYGALNAWTETSLAAGGFHSVAITANHTVVAWGDNTYGQLNVPAGLTNVYSVAAGFYDSVAVNGDGTMAAWGRYYDAGTASAVINASVPAGVNGIVEAAAGSDFIVALNEFGKVAAWGDWLAGSFTNVPANLNNVYAVAAGMNHSMALQNGRVVVWGDNSYGQLNVPADATNVVAIAAGGYHCLALRRDGTVVAWGGTGSVNYGQANVPPGLSNVVAIAGGYFSSLALKNDGTVVEWGYQVQPPPAGLSNVVALAPGPAAEHCLAIQQQIIRLPPPALFIAPAGNGATIFWQNVANWTLQQNSDLANPNGWSGWSASSGASSGVTTVGGTNYLNLASPTGNLFFRLWHP